MSTTPSLPELSLADESVVRAHAEALRDLASHYGIDGLRYASPGRLVGQVADDRDMFDIVEFDLAASELLGAKVSVLSAAVLSHPNVSLDLVEATPL